MMRLNGQRLPHSEAHGGQASGMNQRLRDVFWPEFVCEDTDVPAFGVVEVTDFELKTSSQSGVRLIVQAATTRDEDRYPKFINGKLPVRQNETGICTRSGLIIARMKKPTSASLAYGQWFVADTDTEFILERTKVPPFGFAYHYLGGFQEREDANTGVGVFEYRPVHHGLIYVELTGALAAASSELSAPQTATAKLLERNWTTGAIADSGETLTVVNRWNVAFASGDRLGCDRAQGEWIVSSVDACPEVHEITTTSSPTSGSASLLYDIDGVSGAVTVNWDDTASEVQTAMEAHANVDPGDVVCFGGPLPRVAVYVRFAGDLDGITVDLPTITDGLSGGQIRMRKASAYEWGAA